MLDLDLLFKPKNVAVIGASSNLNKLGGIVMENLIKSNYNGEIFPVNPKGGVIMDKQVIPSIENLPESIDVGIIALDAEQSVSVIPKLGEKKIPFAIIFAGGFAEIRNFDLEKKLFEVCEKSNVKIIGPNCMGLWNGDPKVRFNASFMNILPKITGKVSLLSQSGSLIALAIYVKLRMGKFISIGNALNISFQDMIPFLDNDSNTSVIALYIESFKDGRVFIEGLKKVSKPIITVIAGTTEAGQRSIASHTASLSSNITLVTSLFNAYNIIKVNSFEKLASISRAFELMKLPNNNNVIALSNAGGAVCLFTDACQEFGLRNDPLPDDLKQKLREIFPKQAPVNNPLDLTVTGWTKETIKSIMNILFNVKLHNYGIIVFIPVVAPYQNPIEDANLAIEFSKISPLPFMTCLLAGDKVKPIIPELDKAGIPYCETIRETAEVLSIIYSWGNRKKPKFTSNK